MSHRTGKNHVRAGNDHACTDNSRLCRRGPPDRGNISAYGFGSRVREVTNGRDCKSAKYATTAN